MISFSAANASLFRMPLKARAMVVLLALLLAGFALPARAKFDLSIELTPLGNNFVAGITLRF